ncbi:MAG TPA: tetratricopeptide repeat protein [Phycisphaerae bacterium]
MEQNLQRLEQAADRIRFDARGTPHLDDLTLDEQANPYLLLYKFLKNEFHDANERERALAGAISRQSRFAAALGSLVEQHLGLLRESADLGSASVQELRADVRDAINTLNTVLEQTRDHPPLRIPATRNDANDRGGNRFVYSAQRVPLFGRERELAELWQFLDGSPAFSWWVWTGSGGAGKSRLALELCLAAQWQNWYSGFIRGRPRFDRWDRWRPDCPTLIVFDYVSEWSRDLGRAVGEMQDRSAHLLQPVRFLLLERTCSDLDLWWTEFQNKDMSSVRASIRDAQYGAKGQARDLGPLDESALRQTVDYVLDQCCSVQHRTAPTDRDRAAIIDALVKIDPHRRPLFAAFAAETVAERGVHQLRQWDAAALVQFVLEREVGRWRRTGVDEGHANLLTISTLVGGATDDDIEYVRSNGCADLLPERADVNVNSCHAMYGFGDSSERTKYQALVPDMLGECFVLSRLAADAVVSVDQGATSRLGGNTQRLVDAVWGIELSRLEPFMSRATEDFPTHPSVERLLAPRTDTPKQRNYWSGIVANSVYSLAVHGRFDLIDRLIGTMRALATSYPEEVNITSAVAVALYNRARAFAELCDYDRALNDYTAVVTLTDSSPDVQGLARLNRGVALGRLGRIDEELAEYSAVIAGTQFRDEVRASALLNRAALHTASGDTAAQLADYDAAIDMPGARPGTRAEALHHRACIYRDQGSEKEALTDLDTLLEISSLSIEERVRALMVRGGLHFDRKEYDSAIRDFSDVIESGDASSEMRARALYNRGVTVGRQREFERAISDLTACIETPSVTGNLLSMALKDRAVLYGQCQKIALALADYGAASAVASADPDLRATALLHRASTHASQGNWVDAIVDLTAVVEMPSAPQALRAESLYRRGTARAKVNDRGGAIGDFTGAIEFPNAPVEVRLKAHAQRGFAYATANVKSLRAAIEDFSLVVDAPDASPEERAAARNNRAAAFGEQGEIAKELSDRTAVIESPDAPPDQRAIALNARGMLRASMGQLEPAIRDYRAVLAMPDALPFEHEAARHNLSIAGG